jgi:hypothetical protein
MRWRFVLMSFVAVFLARPRPALADDAGDSGTNGDSGWEASADEGASGVEPNDDGAASSRGPASDGPIVACDGALCDTTNGAECGIARGTPTRAPVDRATLMAVAAAFTLAITRRVRGGARRPSALTSAAVRRPTQEA